MIGVPKRDDANRERDVTRASSDPPRGTRLATPLQAIDERRLGRGAGADKARKDLGGPGCPLNQPSGEARRRRLPKEDASPVARDPSAGSATNHQGDRPLLLGEPRRSPRRA